MTTTDTAALTERLWEAIAEVRDKCPRHPQDAETDDLIAAVLPIIRKAQADAWDEAYAWGCFDDTDGFTRNPHRETD